MNRFATIYRNNVFFLEKNIQILTYITLHKLQFEFNNQTKGGYK